MTRKVVKIEIVYCNARCPYFAHNYEDFENVWCGLLDNKVSEYDGGLCLFDFSPRPIPEECPLEDACL